MNKGYYSSRQFYTYHAISSLDHFGNWLIGGLSFKDFIPFFVERSVIIYLREYKFDKYVIGG